MNTCLILGCMNTSENYWMNRIQTEPLEVIPAKRKLDIEDYLYAFVLGMVWLLSVFVISWKTVMFGGLPMLPTFLILQSMFTTLVVLAWVRTRA